MRQLPELNRNCFILILRTLHTIQHSENFNQSAKATVASSMSQYIIWNAEEDEYGRPSEEKARVFQLLLDNVIEITESTGGLRNRAKIAGIVPEEMKPFGTAGTVAYSSPAESEIKSVANSFTPVIDEGLAAVKQLSDSNEALQALVENLEDSLQSLDGLAIDVGVLRGRLDSFEQRHNALAQEFEEKGSQNMPSNSMGSGKDDSIASLEHKVEAWIQVVQTRLDDIEASHPDEDDVPSAKRIGRDEVQKLIKDSLGDQDKSQDLAFEEWKKKMETDFNAWKEKIMLDAAKVVASQIADVTKRLNESEEKRAEQAKSSSKTDPEEMLKLKKRVEEAGEAEERLNDRIDDLMRSVEDLSERLKAAESQQQKSEEPLKTLQTQVVSLEKRQGSQDEELSGLVVLHSKVDALSHASSAAGPHMDDELREGLRKVEGALPEILEELDAIKESFAAVQERLGKLEGDSGKASLEEKVSKIEEAHEALRTESIQENLSKVERALPEVLEELDVMRENFAAMQERLGRLEEESGNTSLEEKVSKLEEAHEALRQGPAVASGQPTTSSIQENLSKVERALPEVLEELDAIRESFGVVKERVDKLEEEAGRSSLEGKVSKLEEAHEALQRGHAAVSEGHAAAQATSSALNAEVDRLSAAVEALQAAKPAAAAAAASPARDKGEDEEGSRSREGVEEAFGSLFAEHVSPEIASLREAVHALQALIGKPSGSAGAGRLGAAGGGGDAQVAEET
jgi:chromosome segregation ATPase